MNNFEEWWEGQGKNWFGDTILVKELAEQAWSAALEHQNKNKIEILEKSIDSAWSALMSCIETGNDVSWAILEGFMAKYSDYKIGTYKNPFTKYHDSIKNVKFLGDEINIISDGFGNIWDARCPMCKKKTMHVVRPGKAACYNCD